MNQFDFLKGEEKYIEFDVHSCEDKQLIITEANYELRKNGETVERGTMEIDGKSIKALISPDESGVYEAEITVLVPPETIKTVALITVRGR